MLCSRVYLCMQVIRTCELYELPPERQEKLMWSQSKEDHVYLISVLSLSKETVAPPQTLMTTWKCVVILDPLHAGYDCPNLASLELILECKIRNKDSPEMRYDLNNSKRRR